MSSSSSCWQLPRSAPINPAPPKPPPPPPGPAPGGGAGGGSGRSNGHQHRLQRPWLEQHLRILDRHFVQQLIALTSEALEDLHVLGVEEASAREPGLRYESD